MFLKPIGREQKIIHRSYTTKNTTQEMLFNFVFCLFLQPSYWSIVCSLIPLFLSKWGMDLKKNQIP